MEGVIYVRTISFDDADAPPRPSKIIGVGRNYRDHAAEMGNAVPARGAAVFLKAPSSLVYRRQRDRVAAGVRRGWTTRGSSRS